MPWRETTKVSEREEMVEKYRNGVPVLDLAIQFGVSRPTVYLWIKRSEAGAGLVDRPTVPGSCPHETDREMFELLLDAKQEKPRWGPRKQRARLAAKYPDRELPSVSTIGRIYAREGLVKKRRRRSRTIAIRRIDQIEPTRSGEMMSCDHKGWFRLGNAKYCYPLTINDPFSRYIYAIESLESTSLVEAKPVFAQVFREHGLPIYMLSDNGGPFCCSKALSGLTRLSAWWIKLGIMPVRIRKGKPWENGIHERMHKTLKADTTHPPGGDHREQQTRFDAFRKEFNEERPHEGVGDRPPITMYAPAPREYSEAASKAAVEYPGHYEVRVVRSSGEIKWQGRRLFLTEALIGERVGFEEVDDGIWTVNFASVEIGRYDARTKSIV